VLGIFEIGSCELFTGEWFWIKILLISASWVTRITDVSHLVHTSKFSFFLVLFPMCSIKSTNLLITHKNLALVFYNSIVFYNPDHMNSEQVGIVRKQNASDTQIPSLYT
jgi:hypothetical protein